MSDTYKILGQALTGELALDNSTIKETVVYEVPANTQSAVSTIQITNSSPSSQTYKLAFVKDSEVDEAYTDVQYGENLTQSIPQSLNKHFAIYNKTINSGETHEIKGGITLSAGDQIRAYSDSDGIIVNVYGVEIV